MPEIQKYKFLLPRHRPFYIQKEIPISPIDHCIFSSGRQILSIPIKPCDSVSVYKLFTQVFQRILQHQNVIIMSFVIPHFILKQVAVSSWEQVQSFFLIQPLLSQGAELLSCSDDIFFIFYCMVYYKLQLEAGLYAVSPVRRPAENGSQKPSHVEMFESIKCRFSTPLQIKRQLFRHLSVVETFF